MDDAARVLATTYSPWSSSRTASHPALAKWTWLMSSMLEGLFLLYDSKKSCKNGPWKHSSVPPSTPPLKPSFQPWL